MKVLIDITDDEYKGIVQNNPKNFIPIDYCEVIRNGTPLNGTNGEVFGKIMDYMFMDNAYITTDRRGYLHLRGVKDDWWNAPYKGESEEA